MCAVTFGTLAAEQVILLVLYALIKLPVEYIHKYFTNPMVPSFRHFGLCSSLKSALLWTMAVYGVLSLLLLLRGVCHRRLFTSALLTASFLFHGIILFQSKQCNRFNYHLRRHIRKIAGRSRLTNYLLHNRTCWVLFGILLLLFVLLYWYYPRCKYMESALVMFETAHYLHIILPFRMAANSRLVFRILLCCWYVIGPVAATLLLHRRIMKHANCILPVLFATNGAVLTVMFSYFLFGVPGRIQFVHHRIGHEGLLTFKETLVSYLNWLAFSAIGISLQYRKMRGMSGLSGAVLGSSTVPVKATL